MVDPKWKKFEKLVAKIQEYLSPGAVVTHNDKIKGKSGRLRQVDVSIKQKIGQFKILIVMQCKDQKDPIDVNDVESFIGKIKDIEANRGAIVSASGFTSTAIARGKDAGLNLYRLVDVANHEWRTLVTIPVVCDFRSMKSFSLTFSGQSVPQITPIENPRDVLLYDIKNQPIGKIITLIHNLWNQRKLPQEPGEYSEIPLINIPTRIRKNNIYFDVQISLNLQVMKRLFYGELPIKEIRGFKDEIKGGIITRGFTTEKLSFEIVEKEWRQIKSMKELAIYPIMFLQFADYYEAKK